MNKLPIELMCHIFSYLPLSDLLICRLVCKTWKNDVNLKALHKKTVISLVGDECFQNAFQFLAQNSMSTITQLKLVEISLPNELLKGQGISEFFSRLTKLTFRHCKLSNDTNDEKKVLFHILKNCVSLESLGLVAMESVTRNVDAFNDHEWKCLEESLKNVKELDLTGNQTLLLSFFNKLTNCMPYLKKLNVCRNDLDMTDQKEFLSEDSLINFISERAEFIKHLNLKATYASNRAIQRLTAIPGLCLEKLIIAKLRLNRYSVPPFELPKSLTVLQTDEKAISFFVQNKMSFQMMKKLESLYLISSPSYITSSFHFLEKLTFLSITKTTGNGDDLIKEFQTSNFGPQLKVLHLQSLTSSPEKLKNMLDLLPNLEELELYRSRVINNSVITKLSGMKSLRNLDLDNCDLTDFDFLPKEMIAACRKVIKQSLQTKHHNICEIAKKVIASFSMKDKFKFIENLDLSNNEISDITVITALNAKCMRSINLRNCEKITDLGFVALGLQNTSLEFVDVSRCVISDEGLLEMLKTTPRMRNLNLRACQNISPCSVQWCPDLCPYLQNLDIYRCPKISEHFLYQKDIRLWKRQNQPQQQKFKKLKSKSNADV